MTQEEIIVQLDSLIQEDGFLYTYSAVLIQDQFVNIDEASEVNWKERLNYNELALIGRLLVKYDIDSSKFPNQESFRSQIDRLYSLMSKLQFAYYEPLRTLLQDAIKQDNISQQLRSKYSESFSAGDIMVESIFYGDPGALDFQYLEYAEQKYRYDVEWISQELGFSFSSCLQIISELKKIQEKKICDLSEIKEFEDKLRTAFSILCFEMEDLKHLDITDVANFISKFSINPGQKNGEIPLPGFYNLLESKPIINIQDNLFFLPIYFNLAKSIYENPFYWMLEDDKYVDICLKNRGTSAEDVAYDLFSNVFGHENVYREVKVVKQKGNTITDIDILAILGNKAVIIQIKSKRLTLLSKMGNEQQLRADFKLAIQDAYDQGLKSRNELLKNTSKLIDNDNNEIKLHESLDNAYIICLTLDHYPAIPHQIDIYLEKDESDPYPLAFSMFDLDILTYYLSDPFDLLYYINQRVNLQEYYQTNSELSLLAYHLEHKLYKDEDATKCYLDDSFAQLIGDNYPVLKGYIPNLKEVEKLNHGWNNPNFDIMLNNIKDSGNPNFTDAVFFLFDISGQGADKALELITHTKSKSSKDSKSHDCRISFDKGKKGISYYCLNTNSDSDKLNQRVLSHSIISKYKNKSDLWLGLGSYSHSHNLVDLFVFNKEAWCLDPELEELVKHIPNRGMVLNKSLQKIGRNDPCYCGSGKKYKKCCGK